MRIIINNSMHNASFLERPMDALLIDCSIDAIIAIDLNDRIITWNSTAEKIYGRQRAEVLGLPIQDVLPSMKMDDDTVLAITRAKQGIKSFLPASSVYEHRRHAENHFIPLLEDGITRGVMNLMHDVAHRIKAEEELRFLNEALSQKNKQLQERNGELISLGYMASRDIKEPLRKMYTAAEYIIVQDGSNLSNQSRANLRRIQTASQRIGLITDDLLSFTELSEDKTFSTEKVNLNNVLATAKLKMRHLLEERHVMIDAVLLPSLKGNEKLLSQLLYQILHNAVKFQQAEHRPLIKITAHQMVKFNQHYVVLAFKDNGIGFEQAKASEIFNLFTRLHEPNVFPGNGMGLAIAKKIMEQHGGYMEASSLPGAGSTIFCFFPA